MTADPVGEIPVRRSSDIVDSIASALRMHDYDAAYGFWSDLWASGCREPHVWIKVVDLFEAHNLAKRTLPLFLNVALEIGVKNVWVLISLGRMASASGLHDMAIHLCNRALERGVTDAVKWHLLRCLYISFSSIGLPMDALNVFARCFVELPLSCAATLPVSFDEAARLCSAIGRLDWVAILRQGTLPPELEQAETSNGIPKQLTYQRNCNGLIRLLSIPQQSLTIRPPISLNGIMPVSEIFVRHSRPQVNLFSLDDATVIGSGGAFVVITRHGSIIGNVSNYAYTNGSISKLSELFGELTHSARVSQVEVAGVIRDPFPSPNICHFLLDQISRLSLFAQAGLDVKNLQLIGPTIGQKFQTDILELLGLRVEQFLSTSGLWAYKCKRLFISDNVASSYRHPAHLGADWGLSYLRQCFLPQCSKSAIDAPLKLYVSRDKASGRRVKNEDEIRKLLEGSGFLTIYAEEISFMEQVALFSRATHVVGPHGAGLTNIVFCPKNARILELFHPFYGSDAYFYVARGLQLDYCLACDESVPLGDYNTAFSYLRADINAPLPLLEEWLAEK